MKSTPPLVCSRAYLLEFSGLRRSKEDWWGVDYTYMQLCNINLNGPSFTKVQVDQQMLMPKKKRSCVKPNNSAHWTQHDDRIVLDGSFFCHVVHL
jgi:hypothetical protein